MGIYIKGMKMPKNGLYQIVDGTIRLYDYRKIIDGKEKDIQSYNIIEIEKLHGRLIDADKLLEECKPRGIADDVWEESNEYKQIINALTIIEGGETE